jgi:S1-C subfamily serine protease
MNKQISRGEFIAGILVAIILVIVTQLGISFYLFTDFQQEIQVIEDKIDIQNEITLLKIDDTASEIFYQLNVQKIEEEEERLLLEKSTLENLENIQKALTTTTAALQEDLEKQLLSVDTKVSSLEKKSDDLESSMSKISVSSSDFTGIIEEVIESVVSIKTNDGQGSGVIIHKDGFVVTNKHVVEGADSVIIINAESRVYEGEVIAFATNADIAILRIVSDDSFPYLKFEEDVNVGERVIAIGNPYGLSMTVTEGIISALNRNMDSTAVNYIQTDVSINEGNSGGPLVNAGKRIVGINTKKISSGEGLGFAIPASTVKSIADQVINEYTE